MHGGGNQPGGSGNPGSAPAPNMGGANPESQNVAPAGAANTTTPQGILAALADLQQKQQPTAGGGNFGGAAAEGADRFPSGQKGGPNGG